MPGSNADFCTSALDYRSCRKRSGSWPSSAEHQQIIGDDAKADPSLHPALSSVSAAPQAMTPLERADATFAARSPAQGQARKTRAWFAWLARKHDVPDSALVRDAFVRRRSKAAIGDRKPRGAVKELDMSIQGRSPQGTVRLSALTHFVIGDELRLGLLNFYQPSELRRLGQLALPDDVGVWLEETDDLAGIVRITTEHAGPRLRQHTPDEFNRRRQLGGETPAARSRHRELGLAHHGTGDAQKTLVQPRHFRLAPRADRRGCPRVGRPTALGDLEDSARHAARALADSLSKSPQTAGEHPDPISQQRGVRRIMNVGFDDRGVDAEAPAADHPARAAQPHESSEDVLEHAFVQKLRQPDQRFRVGDPFAVNPAERAIDQTPSDLALALIKAPVGEMLEDQHPQHDGGGRSQSAPAPTLGMASRQRLRHTIDEDIIVEQRVDLPKGGVPQLVAVGQEDLDEAALPVRSPHHGASDEADRVSRVARAAKPRRSLTIADGRVDRQGNWRIRTRSDIGTPDRHRSNPLCSAPESS